MDDQEEQGARTPAGEDSISEALAACSSNAAEEDDGLGEGATSRQNGLNAELSSQSVYELPRPVRLPGSATLPNPRTASPEPLLGELAGGNPRSAPSAPQLALNKQSSWVKRVQHRTDELRRLFQLPPGEVGEAGGGLASAALSQLPCGSSGYFVGEGACVAVLFRRCCARGTYVHRATAVTGGEGERAVPAPAAAFPSQQLPPPCR
jgi:hypothetical protein